MSYPRKKCQNCNDRYGVQNVMDDATHTIMHLCGRCYRALRDQLDYIERYKK